MNSDKVKTKYETRIMAVLNKWAEVLGSEPYELTDEEYRWDITVKPLNSSELVDVSLTITEEVVREGEGTGLALFVDIVKEGGGILAE